MHYVLNELFHGRTGQLSFHETKLVAQTITETTSVNCCQAIFSVAHSEKNIFVHQGQSMLSTIVLCVYLLLSKVS